MSTTQDTVTGVPFCHGRLCHLMHRILAPSVALAWRRSSWHCSARGRGAVLSRLTDAGLLAAPCRHAPPAGRCAGGAGRVRTLVMIESTPGWLPSAREVLSQAPSAPLPLHCTMGQWRRRHEPPCAAGPSKPQLAAAARTRGQSLRHRPSGHAARRCLGLGDCRPPRRLSAPIAMSMTTTARRRFSRCWLAAGTTASSAWRRPPGLRGARGAAAASDYGHRNAPPFFADQTRCGKRSGTRWHMPAHCGGGCEGRNCARPGTAHCHALEGALARRRRPAPSPARRICRAPATGLPLATWPKGPKRRPEGRRSNARGTAENSDYGRRSVPPGIA